MGRFFARATRGIEWIAAAEITGRAGGSVHELGHREVLFSAPDPVPLLALRTVDDVFAWAGRVDGLGRERSSLAALDRLGTEAASEVSGALAVAAAVRTVPDHPRFDVTASFLGRRNYNRYDIEDTVGPALARVTGGEYLPRRDRDRTVSRSPSPVPSPTLSWRVHVREDEAILGLRLAARPLHRRAATWATVPGSLHPPVAAALVLLAGVVPEGWLGDPFCGSGTILAEHLHLAPGGRAVGVDIDAAAVAAARANLVTLGGDDRALVARADAAALPVRPGALAVIVTNPPWGRTVSLHGSGPGAAARAWGAVFGALGRAGRLVALTEPPHPATAPAGWVGPVLSFGPLSVSGSKPVVSVFTRPGDPSGGLPPPGALLSAEMARFVHHAEG